ncbi:9587_t:CDS:2, partial [Acaulospora colombiana]
MEMERYVQLRLVHRGTATNSEARILFLADPQIEGDAKIQRQGKR